MNSEMTSVLPTKFVDAKKEDNHPKAWMPARRRWALLALCALSTLSLIHIAARSRARASDANRAHSTRASMQYGEFCVWPNVFRGEKAEYERVALIVHASSGYLSPRIKDQVENWNGPVSLSVYVDDPERDLACAKKQIKALYNSSTAVKYLSVHFFFPQRPGCRVVQTPHKNCTHGETPLEKVAMYPVNPARNLARMFTPAKYILVADLDHMFSGGFEKRVRTLAARELSANPKQLLIYRIFEIEKGVKDPKNKAELQALMNKDKAVVFHARYAGKAHDIVGLARWMERPEKAEIDLYLRNISYNRHDWEPQFVSLSTVPFHDEAFPYQIRDNTCLRWELCRAGYQFSVMTDVFMYHRGIKTGSGVSTARKIQSMNSLRFQQALGKFKARMDSWYPETKKICPAFQA